MAEEEKVTAVAEEATSMADYEKELEASFKKIEEGDMEANSGSIRATSKSRLIDCAIRSFRADRDTETSSLAFSAEPLAANR